MVDRMYGVDLAEAMRAGESIKSSRAARKGAESRNKLTSLKVGELEREISERPEKDRLAKERTNVLTGLRAEAAGGSADAQQKLLSLDPEGAPSFIDAVSKMDERQREQAKRNIDEIGQMSGYVLQAKTPEEGAKRWARVRANVSPEVLARLPEEYDPAFIELSLAKAIPMDEILSTPKSVQLGGQDILYKGGREIDRAQRPTKGSDGKGSGLKSADESLMYRQTAELLGGMFDETGNLRGLDPQTRPKVQAIATRATQIFRDEGDVTRAEAVSMAANEFGVKVGGAPPANPSDPNSIRDYLLKNQE